MKIEINKEKSTPQLQETIWSKVKIKLHEVYGEEEYSNWLKLLSLHSVRNNIVIFNAATKFMCDWINSHYGKKILSLWREFDKLITSLGFDLFVDILDIILGISETLFNSSIIVESLMWFLIYSLTIFKR